MLADYSVNYSYMDVFTPPSVSCIAELKENSISNKIIEDSFLLQYFQKDSSFVDDKICNENDEWNYMSKKEINNLISQYEQQFMMTSDEFLQLRKLGKAPDVFETMVWETLLEFR